MASQPATLRPTGQVTNIWIQDANGKPQMIKLVHAVNTVGKSVPVSVVSAVSGAIRAVLKADGSVLTAKPQQKLHTGQVVRVPGPINGTLVRPVSQMIRLPVIHAENRNAVSITNSASTYQANHLQNNQLKLALPQQTIYHQQQLNNNHQLTNNTAHNPLLNLAMLGARTKRQESDQGSDRKRPKTTPSLAKHGGRGLRYYATVICEKVKRKGITTYSEMADELVAEYKDGLPFTNNQGEFQQDEKNIRRRVYDALNVLVAMNIISKEKNKGMKWVGFPTDSKIVVENLEARKQELLESVKQKQQKVQELVLQQIAYKSLVQRNKQNEQIYGPPPRNSTLQLPFIVVNTNKKTLIEACISSDKLQYLFTFNNIFEIHDIGTVLERMGMTLGLHNANCTEENLAKAKSYVPKALQHYVDQLASGLNEPQLPENVNLEVPESSERSADVVTPTASFSLSFSDDEDFDDHVDDDDEDHSDGGIN